MLRILVWLLLLHLVCVLACRGVSTNPKRLCNLKSWHIEAVDPQNPRNIVPDCRPPKLGGRPYLSIVTATRNDNYGGQPSWYRTQRQVDNIAMLAACTNIKFEHIVVDWNPDPRLPYTLQEKLGCPEYRHVRIITVNNSIHKQVTKRPDPRSPHPQFLSKMA